MRILFFSILLLLLTYSCGSTKEVIPVLNSTSELNAYADDNFAKSGIPGLSIVAFDESGKLYNRNFGYANLEKKQPYDENTIQNIASISKTFLAVALMKAVDQGKLKLDDEINQYLTFPVVHPRFPEIPITVRHLANHTSGIRDTRFYLRAYHLMDRENVKAEDYPKDVRDFIPLLKANDKLDDQEILTSILSPEGEWYDKKHGFTKKAPGEKTWYTNIGANLSALVLEGATKMTYEDYVRQHIFEPLGMKDSSWDWSEVPADRVATRYFDMEYAVPDYELLTRADGGVLTTVSDLSFFMTEMFRGFKGRGSLLTKESYAEMFRQQSPIRDDLYHGIYWEVKADRSVFRHDGGDPGVVTIASYNADKDRAMIVFSNRDASGQSMHHLYQIWNAVGRYDWSKL